MHASVLTVISLLITAAIAAPTAAPLAALQARDAAKCKVFRIFASSQTRSTLAGISSCCCINTECHISDPDDGITATGTPNSSLGVDFTIVDRYGNKGKASLDSDGTTYTAAGLGPCPV